MSPHTLGCAKAIYRSLRVGIVDVTPELSEVGFGNRFCIELCEFQGVAWTVSSIGTLRAPRAAQHPIRFCNAKHSSTWNFNRRCDLARDSIPFLVALLYSEMCRKVLPYG
jgi:hypothetical protein